MAAKKDFTAMEERRRGGASQEARTAMRSRITSQRPTSLPVDQIALNPLNPRYSTDPEVQGLAESYRTAGQLQAAVVVPRAAYLNAHPDQATNLEHGDWVVIIGNRRLLAARVAERPSLDVRVIEELDTADAIEDAVLIENIQRAQLPPLLEAERLKARLDRPGATARTVADAIGKTHTYVLQRVSLLKLVPELQQAMIAGELGVKAGRLIAVLPEEQQRAIAADGPPYTAPEQVRNTRQAIGPADPGPAGNPVSTAAPEVGGTIAPDRPRGPEHGRSTSGDRDKAGAAEAGNRISTAGHRSAGRNARTDGPVASRDLDPLREDGADHVTVLRDYLRRARKAAVGADVAPPDGLAEVREHIEKALALLGE